MAIETATPCPLSVTDGNFATQVAFTFAADFTQRFQLALVTVAEYIVNQESGSDTNYADRAILARQVAINPYAWALNLSSLIAADPASIFDGCTDQDILNRIWTVWPVISYKASTVLSNGSIA